MAKEKTAAGLFGHENVEEYLIKPMVDVDGVQASSGIGLDGKEYPDPVPMAPPIGYQAPPTLMEMIRTMIASEALKASLAEQGFETFEESDDFEIEDDPIDPLTDYERVFEPPATPPAAAQPQVTQEPQGANGGGPTSDRDPPASEPAVNEVQQPVRST